MTDDELITTMKNFVDKINKTNVPFVETDTQGILNQLIELYETITDTTLAAGDPRRLFLCTIAYTFAMAFTSINRTGTMNLLRFAENGYLDDIGAAMDTTRIAATPATTTLKITLSAARPSGIVVPAGTRVTADRKIYFSTDSEITIPAGSTEKTVSATALTSGNAGNGYTPGQINIIVDNVQYVASIVNTTTSTGGADTESDDPYRERIHIAPESFSVAGPDGAYEYWAKSTNADIADICVTSPTPGVVQIAALMKNGILPNDTVLQDILTTVSSSDKRPFTDYVKTIVPEVVPYKLDVTYYISTDNATKETEIKSAVESAINDWIVWTKSKMGRDINTTELEYRIRAAGGKRAVVREPGYAVVYRGELLNKEYKPVQVAVCQSSTVTYGGMEDD